MKTNISTNIIVLSTDSFGFEVIGKVISEKKLLYKLNSGVQVIFKNLEEIKRSLKEDFDGSRLTIIKRRIRVPLISKFDSNFQL
jgi:hypothetical protein